MKAVIVVLLFLVLISSQTTAATIRVPMDQPTIEAGMEAAVAGDTVEVACGTYFESGIELKSGVVLRSQTGQADCVVIDAQYQGIPLKVGPLLDAVSDFFLEGLTFTHGDSAGVWMYKVNPGPVIEYRSCAFVENDGPGLAWGLGYRVYNKTSGTVTGCLFKDNTGAGVSGAGNLNRAFFDCRFLGNGESGLDIAGNHQVHLDLYDCVIFDNGGYGVWFGRSQLPEYLTLHRCQIRNNTIGGVRIGHEEINAEFLDCEISHNGGHGVQVGDRFSGHQFRNCSIRDNLGHGVLISSDESTQGCSWSFWYGNTSFTDCDIGSNRLAGIFQGFPPGRKTLTLERCQVTENGLTGVEIHYDCTDREGEFLINKTTIAGNRNHGLVTESTFACNVNHSLMADNGGGGIFVEDGMAPVILGTDVFGNKGGDWVGDIAPQIDAPGNFWADPCFCSGGYTVAADSPCLPENHPWGWNTIVGALGMGCAGGLCNGPVMIEPLTWGSIKGLYR